MSKPRLQPRYLSQVTYCGGYSGEDPPLPIPNREVKLTSADGTAPPGGRVGSCRFSEVPIEVTFSRGFFFCARGGACPKSTPSVSSTPARMAQKADCTLRSGLFGQPEGGDCGCWRCFVLVVFFVGRVCSCGGPLSCGAVCRCVLGTEAVIFLLAAAFRVMFRAMPFSFLSLEAFSAGNALLFSGSLINSVQAIPFSFQASVIFCTRKGLLRYGICAPCKKQAPGVRDAFSEAFGVKNRRFRYRMDIRYRKPPSLVRDRPGAPKTAS